MTIERANEVLVKCTHLTFSKRERLNITVRQLSQNAIVTLFQMLDILESKEGSLINLGLKFTKRGECRVRIGKNVIISIPDAGTRKEFQTKLLRRWTNHDRYIWYSEEDKLEVLSKMEFDGELKDKHPMYDVIHDDGHVDFPEVFEEPINPTKSVGVIGHNPYYGRGRGKSRARMLVAVAAAQMATITDDDDHAIETVDDSEQAVVVGNPDTARTLTLCIADKLNKDSEKCGYDYTPYDCKPEDESKYNDFPDLSDDSLDEPTEQGTLEVVGANVAGRGSNKANLAMVIALATNQILRTPIQMRGVDEEQELRQRVTDVAREATTLAIENDKNFRDSKPHIVVGSSNARYSNDDSTGLVACIKQKINDDSDIPW